MMGGAAKITLRCCSTAGVYKSIRYSDHRLKTTAAAIIEALRYVPRLSYLHKKCDGEISFNQTLRYIFSLPSSKKTIKQKNKQIFFEITNRIQKSYQKTSFSGATLHTPHTSPPPFFF